MFNSARFGLFAACACLLTAQSPRTLPNTMPFEVASLKMSAGGERGGIRPAPGGERYLATNVSPKLMATVAWQLRDEQIGGGPAWFGDDRYDMSAKAERPSSIEDLHAMLRNLLIDRFRLRFHWEQKRMPVYAIAVDKDGPKMQPHNAQSAGDPWIDNKVDQLKTTMHATAAPVSFLAWRLSLALDRPVIDLTGLHGGYDFDLSFTREPPANVPEGAVYLGGPVDAANSTIVEAMRRDLGLRLQKQDGMVDFLVIDSAEKPARN